MNLFKNLIEINNKLINFYYQFRFIKLLFDLSNFI